MKSEPLAAACTKSPVASFIMNDSGNREGRQIAFKQHSSFTFSLKRTLIMAFPHLSGSFSSLYATGWRPLSYQVGLKSCSPFFTECITLEQRVEHCLETIMASFQLKKNRPNKYSLKSPWQVMETVQFFFFFSQMFHVLHCPAVNVNL